MGLREQVSSRFKVSRWIGDEAIVSCPHPDHDDRNPSAAINVRKRLWVCYSCGRSGRLEALLGQQVTDPDVDDVLQDIVSMLNRFDEPSRKYPESWLDQFDFGEPHPYWLDRGLTADIVRRFRLGYDFESDCVTYPLRTPNGAVLGVVRRVLDDRRPKYRYPDNAPVSKTLFAYYETVAGADDIVITEGALDALAMWDIGVPAVAQMGATLSEEQATLLRRLGPRSITFAYDADPAGQSAFVRAVQNVDLGHAILRRMTWNREDGKDPLELSPDVRSLAYAAARVV